MGLDRKIKLFILTYGRLFLYIIGAIVIFIFILKSFDNYVKEKDIKKEQKEIVAKQERMEENERRNYISKFIKYCESKEIEKAYEMLSIKCKEEKYSNLEEFQNKFIKKIFNLNIDNYKIKKENDIYLVLLTEDMLITGKTTNSNQINIRIENVNDGIFILD